MPKITRAYAERNPLPSPLAKLQAGLTLVNKTETPMRIFALRDHLKLCEESRSQTAALVSAPFANARQINPWSLMVRKDKHTRIAFCLLYFSLERHCFPNQGGRDTVTLFSKILVWQCSYSSTWHKNVRRSQTRRIGPSFLPQAVWQLASLRLCRRLASTTSPPPKTIFANQEWEATSHPLLPARFHRQVLREEGSGEALVRNFWRGTAAVSEAFHSPFCICLTGILCPDFWSFLGSSCRNLAEPLTTCLIFWVKKGNTKCWCQAGLRGNPDFTSHSLIEVTSLLWSSVSSSIKWGQMPLFSEVVTRIWDDEMTARDESRNLQIHQFKWQFSASKSRHLASPYNNAAKQKFFYLFYVCISFACV